MIDMIQASASRLYSITGCEDVKMMVQGVALNRESVGEDRLKSLFFLLLNVDMPLKEYICDPTDLNLYAAAHNLHHQLAQRRQQQQQNATPRGIADASTGGIVEQRHQLACINTGGMQPDKARAFLVMLKRVVNAWLCNEDLTCADLVQEVKQEYLVI